MAVTSQNRTMTVFSVQPASSKWWCRGAMRNTRRRVFRMAPLHHHFELAGWTENTVIVRFWLVTGMSVAFGLGLFYADWLTVTGL